MTTPRKPGHPTLVDGEPTHRITVRLPESALRQLDTAARALGVTRSELLRRLLAAAA